MSFVDFDWQQHLGLSPEPAHHGFCHSQVYDQVRKELVMYGGSLSNETWTMDDLIWTLKSPVFSPSVRSGHVSDFDSHNGRVLMCGGSTTNSWGGRVNDINGWSGINWTEILANGDPGNPTARVNAGAAYDAKRKKFVMCGGWYGTNNSQATIEFDVTTDTWATWGNGPWERRSHCRLAYDPVLEVVWMVGGYAYPQASDSYRYRDTWKFDGSNWTELTFGAGDDIPTYFGLINTGTQRTFDIFIDATDGKLTLLSSYVDGGHPKLGIASLDPSIPKWTVDKEIKVADVAAPGTGWTLGETPVVDFHTEDSKIYCFFSPSQATETYQTWSLEAVGPEPPHFENQDPAPGATGVSAGSSIYAEVIDDNGDLVASSVELYVNGTLAWKDDSPVGGFTGVRVATTNGYGYTLTPGAPFEAGVQTVQGLATDAASQSMDESYSFSTAIWQVTEQDIAEALVSPGIDLKLASDDHDVVVEDYDLVLVAGADEVAQHLLVHMKLFRGEWYLDDTAGVPYFSQVFVHAPSSRVIETLFRQLILSDGDISGLDEFTMEINSATRHLDLSFSAVSSVGVVDVKAVVP